MNNEQNKKVEEILGSLDGTRRASMPDFFYTRLKARMERGFEPAINKSWLFRPVYAITALAVVLLINAAVIFNGTNTSADEASITEIETLQSYAAEYRLNDTVTEELYK
jgi:hypothetical protein